MADHGLTLSNLPTMRWKWVPEKPLPLTEALPATSFSDDSQFRQAPVDNSPECAEAKAYRFSFPQLSRQTPDLHFYRLIQVLNTPLLCLDSRDMGRSDFAYWRGVRPSVQMRLTYLYVWFFRDQNDHDLIVGEYGFDGMFTLRSEKKPEAQLQAFYQEICGYINAGRASDVTV